MFKSERRPRQYSNRDRDQNRDRDKNRNYSNDFRGFAEKKKVEVNLTEADFPELIAKENAVAADCKLNFKEAYLKEVINDGQEDDPLLPGWTRYRVKDGVLIVDGESTEEEEYTAEEYHYDATQIFDCLIKRWDNYKEEYDDLHGDGAYDRVYKMPQYESFEEEEYDEWEQ
jgi:hypothetical protein